MVRLYPEEFRANFLPLARRRIHLELRQTFPTVALISRFGHRNRLSTYLFFKEF